jgi:outer membrane protein assembly factor BamB
MNLRLVVHGPLARLANWKPAMTKRILSLFPALFCTTALAGPIFPADKPEWTVDFTGGAVGHPAHFGSVEKTRGVLVTEHSGKITLVSPTGEKRLTMNLDLPVETPAVAADLRGDGKLSVVAVDAWGSIYCFDEQGRRQWKFSRAEKSGEFRLPVFADLDGDGRLEILVPDSRGHLDVLDSTGHLRLEITATKYRVGVPAVGDVNGDGKSEIIFGTEAGEVYCLSNQGDVLWSTTLDGCFGRALPLIADADGDGHYELYFPTAFNNAHPGLFALDAATGKLLWKAPSVLQSYRSTVVADLHGDGRNEILFGDKNSSLFCLEANGKQRWTTQLPGRGIFFAPAVADLQGNGASTAFAVVRNAGSTGKSLYALAAAGKVVDELALPGGGGCSPILCRFEGRADVSLVVLSGSGQLQCHRLEQKSAGAKILWPGVRNDLLNSGFIKSAGPAKRGHFPAEAAAKVPIRRGRALGGTNKLPLPDGAPEAELVSVRTALPDGSRRVELLQKAETGGVPNAAFAASVPGRYDVTVRWHDVLRNTVVQSQRFVYHLDPDFPGDAARVREVISELRTIGRQSPALADLTGHFEQTTTLTFAQARRTQAVADFDELRRRCDYYLGLARHVRDRGASGGVLLHQLANPWENFDAGKFFASKPVTMNSISVTMLGNEYESVAVALSNLRAHPVTLRLACGPFQSSTNRIESKPVLALHDVFTVRPDGTGEPTEDPLPLLGESQTVRLEAGETHKLWLTFHSRSLSLGTWRATMKIGDIAAPELPTETPVTVEVHPVRLPDRFTYRECNWLYLDGIRDEALQDATMRDALEHGMNVFVIPGVSIQADEHGALGKTSTEAHDKLVRKLGSATFFLISGPVSVQWPAQFKPDAQLQEKVFADALRWYRNHMQSLGVGYEDFAIYLQDEPGLLGRDAGFEAFVAQVKRFKAAEPRIQLYANPAGGARAELLRPLQDLIDVWAPDLHLVREQPEALTEIFRHGKQYWHYEAPGDQRYLDPLGFYRMKPWVAFQMGMTGGGYWVYSSANYWFAEPGGGSEYGSVYPTERGPVTTKRWEASRDGIEDFELLWLVRKTAEQSSSPARRQALDLVDEAVRFVTRGQEKVTDISRHVRPYTPDFQRWMEYRQKLIRTQMRLTN